ncbi:MAG: hypothetical protein TREMPRED_003240 [Tremellales sp. Tagirdzhanova-0007]|nr:MAG: hypothetical protein TREMPRED_003240 [Tremellales sp. Tagirdzhanova-0007]
MSLRLVPPTISTSSNEHVVSIKNTAHPLTGTHDTFRHGLTSAAQGAAVGNMSPMQARLEKWATTQSQLQQTLQRDMFGLSVPLRQAMELKIVSESLHNPLLLTSTSSSLPLGGSYNLALEILEGNDEHLDVTDFMGGDRPMREVVDVNKAMEHSRGI